MTRRQVLEYLAVRRGVLERLEQTGRLTPIRVTQRTLRYRRSDIEAFLAEAAK
jgi:predicted site-specific integrase-resolvase